jgi:hypothetical protein
VSAVALSAAAALGVAACGSSDDDSAGAVTNRQSNSQTSNQSNSQQSSNQSNSSSTQGSGSMSQSSFSTDKGPVNTYAGTDEAKITVDVEGDSRLLWSNDKGRPFRLSGIDGDAIDSTAGSGEVPLSGGKHRLEVRGDVWTIVIRPG